MALNTRKHTHKHAHLIRDIRPWYIKLADGLMDKSTSAIIFILCAASMFMNDWALAFSDLIMVFLGLYAWWLSTRNRSLAFKLPMGSPYKDKNNEGPGRSGEAEGIFYIGNTDIDNEEVWFTNSDIRTHILYLGTTGAGKTEGLKSMVTNTLTWSSGFVYVDGKADTDLWSSLSAMVRRFGRDDDLLVLNYMTGNSDVQAPSNSMNPFSSGSASYLTNMLVSLMPESQGDNAMWSERAISLVSAIMPVLTWKRDNQEIPLSVKILRDNLSLPAVIRLARDEVVPSHLREGLVGYLDTLPGYNPDAYDDDGKTKPPSGGGPPPDTQTASQQHGYLAMQFTRSLQSLGDDYGYIFDTQAADVDMVDVVLNRRILVVLIPALEKSGDEIANLGKIVAATIKGMMGSTLGSTVEGSSETVIENKPTHSSTPFMTVFDEVGYYTAEGMAVMAAQARSLGFSLVFSGQDLPAMKKRVREEANSITANCNLKLFGKLEDPTETKEFFEKTVGSAFVTEVSGFQGGSSGVYSDNKQASVQDRPRAHYDGLRAFKEGQAVVTFGEGVYDCRIFYSNPGHAKAMRVTRFLSLAPPSDDMLKNANTIRAVRDLLVDKNWNADKAEVAVETSAQIEALDTGYHVGDFAKTDTVMASICALVSAYSTENPVEIPQKAEAPAAPETPAQPQAPTADAPAQEASKADAPPPPPAQTAPPPSQPASSPPAAEQPHKNQPSSEAALLRRPNKNHHQNKLNLRLLKLINKITAGRTSSIKPNLILTYSKKQPRIKHLCSSRLYPQRPQIIHQRPLRQIQRPPRKLRDKNHSFHQKSKILFMRRQAKPAARFS